ncbi:MAG: hypothetical protein MI919_26110 [Holophagales bacterium]|nr:hypothetical protein [Holophagales bacterium]
MTIQSRITLCIALFLLLPAVSAAATIDITPIGDPTADCNSVIAALSSLTSSETLRHVIRLGPGVYDCDNQTIVMKPWIDLVGSGRETTEIRGKGGNGLIRGAADSEIRDLTITVNPDGLTQAFGIKNSQTSFRMNRVKIDISTGGGSIHNAVCTGVELTSTSSHITSYLRELEVHIRCEGSNYGIVASGKVTPTLQRDYVKVTSGSNDNVGVWMKITPTGGLGRDIEIRDVILDVYGPTEGNPTAIGLDLTDATNRSVSIYNSYIVALSAPGVDIGVRASNVEFRAYNSQIFAGFITPATADSSCNATGGVYAITSTKATGVAAMVESSVLKGNTRVVCNTGSGVFRIASSRYHGGPPLGTVTCAGAYDAAFNPLGPDCQ